MEAPETAVEVPRRWSIASTVWYSLLLALVVFVAEAFSTVVVMVIHALSHGGATLDNLPDPPMGILVSSATVASAVAGVPFVRYLAGRREPRPWTFLGFVRVPPRTLLVWCAYLAAFIVVSDGVMLALGQPVVQPFMIDILASTPLPLLLVVLVVAAPLAEELFFRGLLSGALEASGASPVITAVITAGLWASLHSQYDLYGLTAIFAMGLLLAVTRVRTGSIVPCLARHGLANAVALAQVVVVTNYG